MLELGEKHGYRNAQVTVHRADRHHRPGHGLRHHRHRAGLRPGEVQEARRRRLLQDHQRLDPAGPGAARLHAAADRRHRPLLPRGRHARRLPAHQPGQPQGQGLHRRGPAQASKRSCPAPSSCRSSSTAGPSATSSSRTRSASPTEQLDAPGVRPARRTSGFTQRADRRGQRLRLRHHDHRRRAAPASRSTTRSSTAPTSAARSASGSCRPSRTSA